MQARGEGNVSCAFVSWLPRSIEEMAWHQKNIQHNSALKLFIKALQEAGDAVLKNKPSDDNLRESSCSIILLVRNRAEKPLSGWAEICGGARNIQAKRRACETSGCNSVARIARRPAR